jgi:hypothetical protein
LNYIISRNQHYLNLAGLTGYTVKALQKMTYEQSELLTIAAIRNNKPAKKGSGLPGEVPGIN